MMPGDGGEDPLIAPIHGKALLDLRHGCGGAGEVAFVDHDDVCCVEHGDFLKLEPAAVVGPGDENRFVHEAAAKGKRFLADANRLDKDDAESAALHRSQPAAGFWRKSAGASPCGEAAHEDAI